MRQTSDPAERAARAGEIGGMSPKIEPLSGTLMAETKACGKPACRCARGELHGPYWRRYWREAGRRRRRYVKRADVEQVRGRILAWRRLHPPTWTARQALAELRRACRELETLGG